MRFRYYFLFIFFTLLFLFYPGDSPYYNILAYNRNHFLKNSELEGLRIFPVPFAKTNVAPIVTAEGVYITDLASFTPVYSRNSNIRFFPASTTKVMSALVAYDLYNPDDIVTVNRVLAEGQVMGLVQGERITVENLLYGMLIHSGNDAAYALADHYGEAEFINKMNKKAQELHMTNSHFSNPAGLDSATQLTTPYDLTLAARELLKNPYLKKMVSIKEITISDADYKIFHRLSNVNRLLGEVQGLGGLKTGYTEQAGENLISFYKYGQHDYVIVIMKSLDRFQDTKNVIQWIQTNVDYVTIDRQLLN